MAQAAASVPSERRPITPRTLPQILWEVADQVWNRQDITFVPAFPGLKASGKTIAWRIWRRLPGRLGTERYKDRVRYSEIDTRAQSETLYRAQWQTVYYQFDCYALSPGEADELAEDWENLLRSITGLLQSAGVSEFLFDEELSDDIETSVEIHRRRLRFLCVMERRHSVNFPTLRQVWLRVISQRYERTGQKMVRQTGDRDTLPDKWLDRLYSVRNSFTTQLLASSDYVYKIDYTLTADPDGTCHIDWLPDRARPSPGATYYVNYAAFDPEALQSLAA